MLVNLEFESIASVFPEDCPATFEPVFGYTIELMTMAYDYGFDTYAEPQELPMDNEYREASLKISHNCRLLRRYPCDEQPDRHEDVVENPRLPGD